MQMLKLVSTIVLLLFGIAPAVTVHDLSQQLVQTGTRKSLDNDDPVWVKVGTTHTSCSGREGARVTRKPKTLAQCQEQAESEGHQYFTLQASNQKCRSYEKCTEKNSAASYAIELWKTADAADPAERSAQQLLQKRTLGSQLVDNDDPVWVKVGTTPTSCSGREGARMTRKPKTLAQCQEQAESEGHDYFTLQADNQKCRSYVKCTEKNSAVSYDIELWKTSDAADPAERSAQQLLQQRTEFLALGR